MTGAGGDIENSAGLKQVADTENWSYKDARLNIMSAEVAQWTEAPEKKKKSLDRRGSCFEPSRRLAPFPADFDLSFQTGEDRSEESVLH